MNENESMDLTLEEHWADEGGVGADETGGGPDREETGGGAQIPPEAPPPPPPVTADMLRPPKGEPGKPHPLLERARERARRQDMERFLTAFPQVRAEDIPREVWAQTAQGVPLVSAWAMHENRQLKAQLAAQRQDQLNRRRSPGALGANMGSELDELDRIWAEED